MDKPLEVEIEVSDEILLKLSLDAHNRNVTLNSHINDILKTHLETDNYTFEDGTKPQFLVEG